MAPSRVSAPPDDALLQARRLTKRYRRLVALDEVTFSVRRGEVLGLIGPNGSGKTTLFECLGGVLPFDSGEIESAGRRLRDVLFYVPDGIAPWPSERVGWALDFVQGLFGCGGVSRDRVIDQLGLSPLLDTPIGQLSKGQRKRAMLALGLSTPRELVLADEPFDGLDLRQSREVGAALRAFVAGGRTLLLSIHQIADAARVCDRLVLLSGGRVRAEGTAAEIMALASARSPHPVVTLEEAFLALT